jgi:hypothetical protein
MLLEEADLVHAPSAVQEAFWHRHNRSDRPRRRLPASLGELASGLLAEHAGRPVDLLSEVNRAWMQVVPPAHRSRTRVISFRGGCLEVGVDGTLKFVYRRGMRGNMLSALNAELAGVRVARIEYRAGSTG